MAQRESIYLYLFIVSIVLFLGSTFSFMMVYNKNEELKKDMEAAKERAAGLERNQKKFVSDIGRLRALIAGDAGDSVGATEEEIETFRTTHLGKIEGVVKAALQDLGQSTDGASFVYLIEPYDRIEDLFKSYRTLRDEAFTQRTVADKSLEEKTAETDATLVSLNGQIKTKNDEVAALEQQFEDCQNERQEAQGQSVRKIGDLEEEIADLNIRASRDKSSQANQISTLRTKLDQVKREARLAADFAELEPDGRLFKVVPQLGKGWVDLGRQDHLMKGLVFRVFQVVKGGKKVYKGKVDIRKVDERMAEVRILEEVDSLNNPISDGDYIASPFYDIEEKPVFVLAGTELSSNNITIDYLRSKLGTYGVELRKNVDINTTFLVALKDYSQSEQYTTARELEVPVLRESDLLEFIGY